MSIRSVVAIAIAVVCSLAAASAQEVVPLEPIPNWPAPPYWMPVKPPAPEKGAEAAVVPEAVAAVPTAPLAFTGIAPCRIADTRGNGFTGAYGPPALTQGSPRNFTLAGQCGIPGGAEAVSLNVTVTNTQGPGFILIYPQGAAQPTVSTLNYVANQTIANAAVVPLGTAGGVTVIAGVSGTDLIIDTNGYYAAQTVVNTVNGLSGAVSLTEGGDISITPVGNSLSLSVDATPLNTSSAIVRRDGSGNFAAGSLSLSGNLVLPTTSPTAGSIVQDGTRLLHTFGFENVFLGPDAGNVTMTGFGANTGIGFLALNSNTTGDGNTAIGTSALRFNTTGHLNTAGGQGALQANIGGNMNTAYGWVALLHHTNGDGNTAIGVSALEHSTGGSNNTAIGYNALLSNSTGSGNTAVGFNAGSNLTTGGNNIDIGHAGVADEANTIRIGTGGTNTRAFLAGVRGVTTGAADALTVMIDSNGQLGTISSSASVKREISDVGDASLPLLKLRPVSFLYRNDTEGIRQYGLIAEEVAEVMPELVQFSPADRAETIRYHFLAPLLLNELQRQELRIEKQEREIGELRALVEALSARSEAACSTSR